MLGLVLWGGLHAYGAYLMNHNPLRGLVIGAFTGGFLGFWGLLLFFRWDHLTGGAKESTSGGRLVSSLPASGTRAGEGANDPTALPAGRESS